MPVFNPTARGQYTTPGLQRTAARSHRMYPTVSIKFIIKLLDSVTVIRLGAVTVLYQL